MLDTGTTTSYLARELLHKHGLTVVTNSSDIARTLSTVSSNKVHMAGGVVAISTATFAAARDGRDHPARRVGHQAVETSKPADIDERACAKFAVIGDDDTAFHAEKRVAANSASARS